MTETRPNDSLRIGEMPQPIYLIEAGSATESEKIKWIGMKAYGLNGQIGDFLWWKNFQIDLNNEIERDNAASFITQLKLEMMSELAVGLPIDLGSSNPERNYVAVLEVPKVYGVYIESQKRQGFNFMFHFENIRPAKQLREKMPAEFEEIFQKAKAVLPYRR